MAKRTAGDMATERRASAITGAMAINGDTRHVITVVVNMLQARTRLLEDNITSSYRHHCYYHGDDVTISASRIRLARRAFIYVTVTISERLRPSAIINVNKKNC